jgi:hypothetical protein
MTTVKQALVAVGLGVAATVSAGVVGFLSEVHLEISFEKLKDFKLMDLSTWGALGTAFNIELETAADQDFIAYWVDDDDGKPVVRKSSIAYKNFHLNNRIAGKLVDDDDKTAYSITGYYNSRKLVFSHRGPQFGTGVHILDLVQLSNITGNIYAGYAIIEDQLGDGGTEYQVLQCPFIMIDETVASKKFPSIDAAKGAFPFLGKSCVPFKMPGNVTSANAANAK